VDKRTASSETQACSGADDARGDTQSVVQGESATDGEEGKGETCAICLVAYDNPVPLLCWHNFSEVCLDGWHKKSKFDANQPRNCPMCRHSVKPSQEVISRLYSFTRAVETRGHQSDQAKISRDELLAALLKKGHTKEEINDMVAEYRASQIEIPGSVVGAALSNDAKTVLDWLGSPVDAGKLKATAVLGTTILHISAMNGSKDLANILMQHGAAVDVYDSNGATPV